MTSRTLFADAFYWIALISPRDAHHASVVSLSQTLASTRLVTGDEVLSEVLTHFCRSGAYWRMKAVAFVRDICSDPAIDVLPQTRDSFQAALALYDSRLDKEYSLTDCRSLVAMKSLGISEALTNDHHFAQEGLVTLFP